MDLAFISSLVIGSQRNCIAIAIRLIMCRAAGNIAIRKRTSLRHVRHVFKGNVLSFHLNQIRVQLTQVYDITDSRTAINENCSTG